MGKSFYSGDIETSGPVAPLYTMLSVGYCIVGETQATFYAELKPITSRYDLDAMRVGCKGLLVVRDREGDPLFDTASDRFDPLAVLGELDVRGEDPGTAMRRLAAWIRDTARARNTSPRALYAPSSFESSFLPYYFHAFTGGNPLGHSAEDAGSYLHGASGDESASLASLGLRPTHGLSHNALDDAIQQAREFEDVRKRARKNRH
jgi:hypothetical protein